MSDKKKCFVVMGFGEKTDYQTSRVLDLDKTYKHIIKKAVQDAGLECVRADEIPHSGTIEMPMFEQLLQADLVIADLSTSNLNAAYELGVRHALKPRTTIIIAEDKFVSPFDTGHIATMRYRHDGKALDIDEVERFREVLNKAIAAILANPAPDSPVYTFLRPLTPPVLAEERAQAVRGSAVEADAATGGDNAGNPALAVLMEQLNEAKKKKDFDTAKSLLKIIIGMTTNQTAFKQQLALVTYKSKKPDELSALKEAQAILGELNPMHSNNAETLGLWGAVHKRLFEIAKQRADLDTAILSYEKGYWLLSDYYNGINWAFLLNVRASLSGPADAITDFVLARRTRADVLEICKTKLETLKDSPQTRSERYWILATMAEACLGLEDAAQSEKYLNDAKEYADEPWMLESTLEQLEKLRAYLEHSPLKNLPV
ncbi:MAG: TRAFs-binding domain-containing protein [Methylococcales bacterium]|nr:TRAFs-binding domain-containing protein [Methylococcales bacterium]